MHQEAAILQERIEVGAVGRRAHEAFERAARGEQEQQEAEVQQAEHAEQPTANVVRQAAGAEARRPGPAGEHQRPQQKRPLVAAPGRAQPEVPGQRPAGIAGDVGHREIVAHEGMEQRGEAEAKAGELRRREGDDSVAPSAAGGAPLPQKTKRQGQNQRRDRCEMAKLDDHRATIAT